MESPKTPMPFFLTGKHPYPILAPMKQDFGDVVRCRIKGKRLLLGTWTIELTWSTSNYWRVRHESCRDAWNRWYADWIPFGTHAFTAGGFRTDTVGVCGMWSIPMLLALRLGQKFTTWLFHQSPYGLF